MEHEIVHSIKCRITENSSIEVFLARKVFILVFNLMSSVVV